MWGFTSSGIQYCAKFEAGDSIQCICNVNTGSLLSQFLYSSVASL